MSIEFYYLALIRLAKFQVTTFGHPETTGSKSIDYYLISKNVLMKTRKNTILKNFY